MNMNKKITVNFCDPDIGIDIIKQIFKREEWIVPCNWCGAKVGEPCYERGIPYENKIHETRKEYYLIQILRYGSVM